MHGASTSNHPPGGVERRLGRRSPSFAIAKVVVRGDEVVEGRAVDESTAGICVTLPVPLRLGAVHQIVLSENAEGEKARRRTGRVCFCLKRSDEYRIGFQVF